MSTRNRFIVVYTVLVVVSLIPILFLVYLGSEKELVEKPVPTAFQNETYVMEVENLPYGTIIIIRHKAMWRVAEHPPHRGKMIVEDLRERKIVLIDVDYFVGPPRNFKFIKPGNPMWDNVAQQFRDQLK